jgi:hypothetical protein
MSDSPFNFVASHTFIDIFDTNVYEPNPPISGPSGALEFVFSYQMHDGNDLFINRSYNEVPYGDAFLLSMNLAANPSLISLTNNLLQSSLAHDYGLRFITSEIRDLQLPLYTNFSSSPQGLGYRLMEVASAKIFGQVVPNAIFNSSDYTGGYETGTSPNAIILSTILPQLDTGGTTDFLSYEQNHFIDFYNSYKSSGLDPVLYGVERQMNFQRSEWFFPITFSTNVMVDGNPTNPQAPAPFFGGNRLDQGINILLFINAGH